MGALGTNARLPGRPVPWVDESFHSWLNRIADSNGITLTELVVHMRERVPIRTPEGRHDYLSIISSVSGIPAATLTRAFQSRFGQNARFVSRNQSSLDMPIDSQLRPTFSGPLAYCPFCLGQKNGQYFRKLWTSNFYTFCPRHRVMMQCACPVCLKLVQVPRVVCNECGSSLYGSQRVTKVSVGGRKAQNFRKALGVLAYLATGDIDPDLQTHLGIYFGNASTIASSLAKGITGDRLGLRRDVQETSTTDAVSTAPENLSWEGLPIDLRHSLLLRSFGVMCGVDEIPEKRWSYIVSFGTETELVYGLAAPRFPKAPDFQEWLMYPSEVQQFGRIWDHLDPDCIDGFAWAWDHQKNVLQPDLLMNLAECLSLGAGGEPWQRLRSATLRRTTENQDSNSSNTES